MRGGRGREGGVQSWCKQGGVGVRGEERDWSRCRRGDGLGGEEGTAWRPVKEKEARQGGHGGEEGAFR